MYNTANEKVRAYLRLSGFAQWQLAHLLGVSEGILSRMMRYELPEEVQTGMIDVLRCFKDGKDINTDFFWDYKTRQNVLSEAKRIDAVRRAKSELLRQRLIDRGLDEAEKRRMDGGWDLSL